ncbi:hypothetical protein E5161_04490 [Cohnella pontilimi]|uniref:YceG-like family protein n=1 Tax=Cohnella pontilimi TaxID=2564100 RepID=A0A4U0FE03_9BACL|nr:hypothetical protein [Cohnella pontilimi]TJY43163.1 hypothetical protein E5161_04490 [Cohnella pontilimi]
MRKHRSWLMGFGIGIILGACMLQLITFSEKQDQALSIGSGALTRAELEQAAQNQGLALLPADEKTYTQQQLEQEIAKAKADSSKGQATEDPENRSVSLYVKYNTSLEEIAWKLEALEVIKDADDFISKAYDIRKKLAIGTSTFKDQPTYKQIMDELTRIKKDE